MTSAPLHFYTQSPPPPLKRSNRSATAWRSILGVAGIVLLALNLRDAVPSVTPLYGYIRQSFPVGGEAEGILGTLPLVCFAIFGQLAPRLTRRFGLEGVAIIAMLMLAIGEAARAMFSPSILVFGMISVVALGGMGLATSSFRP